MPPPRPSTEAMPHNAWLDVCRSAAILLVLLSHGRHFLTPAWEQASVFRVGGFLGVELFFVLSGFLVGGILQRSFIESDHRQPWLARFLLRRWMRTLPTYYLFLAVNALLIAYAIAPGQLAHLLPFAFFAQNLAWPGPPEFGEAWSLAVEEVFYLTFPLSLLLIGKLKSNQKTFVMVAIALSAASILGRIFWVIYTEPSWNEGVRAIVVFRLDALMFGVLMGCWIRGHRWAGRVSKLTISLGALTMTVAVISLYFWFEPTRDQSYFYRIWLFPLTSVAAALVIWAGLHWMTLPGWLSISSQRIARWSYALYLVHMPIFYLIAHCTQAASSSVWISIARWISFIAISMGFSAVITHYFEEPILRLRNKRVPR